MNKTELTLKQMVEAVKANVDKPWEVVGIGRSSWFRILQRNGSNSMNKTGLTLKQMVEAVKTDVDKPWEVVGIGRSSWFRILQRNGTTMKELQSQFKMKKINGNDVKNKYRHSTEWKQWRKTLLEDWDGKCACCGCKTETPQLHHMTPSEYTLLERERFVFVCRACHEEISRLERIKRENWCKYDTSWVTCFGRFIKE